MGARGTLSAPTKGHEMIQAAVLSGRMEQRDDTGSEGERQDDLGFVAGLRLLIPAGILLWIAIAYFLMRFL